MRRTLALVVATAAFLAPAAAASAAPAAPDALERSNASCNNGQGGNYAKTKHDVKAEQIRVGASPSCEGADTPPNDGPGGGVDSGLF